MIANHCRNCGADLPPAKAGRLVCSVRCRAMLGAKARAGQYAAQRVRERIEGECPYCRRGTMPLVSGQHVGADGRVYPCGPRPQGGEPKHAAVERSGDVHAMLDAAVRREMASPWVRHPEPWTDVVYVRRQSSAEARP